MRRMSRAILVSAVALSSGSCALMQQFRFEPPTVDVVGIRITGLGLQGGSFDLLLDVHNPNSYALRTARIEASLDLEDIRFGDALLERGPTLESNSTTWVAIPVAFTWDGAGAGARALLTRGSVRYGLVGRVWGETPRGRRAAEVTSSGSVPITSLLR